MRKKLLSILALLCITVASAWATEKSIDDIAVDDIIKLGDVISYTDYLEITYDGHTIPLGNWSGAGTVTVTRGIPDYTNVEDANGAYFLFNDSKTGLQGSYGLPDKTIGGIPYNESGLKVTDKKWDASWDFYTLTVELAPASAEPVASAEETTVTFTPNDLTNGAVWDGAKNNVTKDGVTFTAEQCDGYMIYSNPATFTNSLGGNFTQIVVTAENVYISGDGWSGNTWTGKAESVSADFNIEDWSGITIVCTIETPPATYDVTANLADGAYWSTFYSNEGNYQAPEGTQVFAVNLTGTALTLTEISDRIVKSGEGVVLKNSTTGSITMTLTVTAPAGDFSGNSLQGTMTSITNPGNAYVLNTGTYGVGFYKLTAGGAIGANKAYLTYSGGEAKAREFFGFDETTGIEMLKAENNDNANAVIYNLQGHRVQNPTKGLYIVNGKKVFINK